MARSFDLFEVWPVAPIAALGGNADDTEVERIENAADLAEAGDLVLWGVYGYRTIPGEHQWIVDLPTREAALDLAGSLAGDKPVYDRQADWKD